jgi:hypothetical protein
MAGRHGGDALGIERGDISRAESKSGASSTHGDILHSGVHFEFATSLKARDARTQGSDDSRSL